MSPYYKRQNKDRCRYNACTKDHRMTVLHDDGLYRSIRFAKPGTISYSYTLTTIPGYLFVTGDMGEYVFARERDMFDFHRINWRRNAPTIDYRYWAEKCQAVDVHGGLTRYDPEKLKAAAVYAFRHYDFLPGCRMDAWSSFRQDVLERLSDENLEHDMCKVMEWRIEGGYPFYDFYDYGPFQIYTEAFRWTCWAIAEGIRAYDTGGTRRERQETHDKLILSGQR